MSGRIYLDHNATSPILPEALEAMVRVLKGVAGNPSSAHREGQHARRIIEHARGQLAALLGAQPGQIMFTASATEANAAAILGLGVERGGARARVVVISSVEHPSISQNAARYERGGGIVRRAGVDSEGVVDLAALHESLAGTHGAVVCVQLANSETGVIQQITEVTAVTGLHAAFLHCDATQAVGKIPVDFEALGCASMSLSAHKFGGPPGVGALVIQKEVAFEPLVSGNQESGRRGGTENIPAIAGAGVAADLARSRIAVWQALAALRDEFELALLERGPKVVVYGAHSARLPNVSCLGLPAPLRGGAAVAALDLEGFALSSGPACSSGVEEASAVIAAMGFGNEAAGRTLRVSLGPTTSREDVMGLADALARLVRRATEDRR